MLANATITAMCQLGALKIKNFDSAGNAHFDIDFKRVEAYFPQCLEDLVLSSLGMYDQEVYELGFLAYIIQDDGSLLWKPTRKLHAIIDP